MWSWITNPNPDPPKGTHPWSLRLIIFKYRTQFSLFSILQYFIVGRLDNWHTESKYCVGTSSRLPYDYMDLFCVPFLKEAKQTKENLKNKNKKTHVKRKTGISTYHRGYLHFTQIAPLPMVSQATGSLFMAKSRKLLVCV